ncbi:hypothetical protein V6Z69_19465 [Cereibacter sphaeroides]|uniref:hypothetical protein n=1 Tax=Cereibacter sphaeroides TaxID=1063 RepID=UPI003990C2E6
MMPKDAARAALIRARGHPARIACFIARREGFSLTQIGTVLRRDHSSIRSALQREQRRRGGTS